MAALALISAALAHPPDPAVTAELGELTAGVSGALGGRLTVFVGEDASFRKLDGLTSTGARVYPLALTGSLQGPRGGYALLRVEEAGAHAGSLEAAEARLGIHTGMLGGWIGSGDIPVTRDRDREMEDRHFMISPMLSRILLPAHASGVSAAGEWPERAGMDLGLSWPTATADAAYRWGRIRLHPLGEVSRDESSSDDGVLLQLAAGGLWQDSESLGELRLGTVDAEIRYRSVGLAAAYLTTDGPTWTASEIVVWAWGRLLSVDAGALSGQVRVERVAGVLAGEDARLIGSARLAVHPAQGQIDLFVEGMLSREKGDGVVDGEDVISLGRGIEHENDTLSLGARMRF